MDKKKIVIIDDEKDLATFIRFSLEATGKYEALTAVDGTSGEEICIKENPDLIFLDFVLPGKRGDDVLDSLRSHPNLKKTPVIIISGLGEIVFVQKSQHWRWLPNRPIVRGRGILPEALHWDKDPELIAAKMNVQGFLAKPFTTEILLAATERALSKPQAGEETVPGSEPGV